jgi:hypothetical protein
MSRWLLEDPMIDEGGDVSEDLSNQPDDVEDASND